MRRAQGRRKQGTRGAAELREYSTSSSANGNTAVEKLRSSSLSLCITYLQYCALWEQTTGCIRRPQRESKRKRVLEFV